MNILKFDHTLGLPMLKTFARELSSNIQRIVSHITLSIYCNFKKLFSFESSL